MNKFSRDELDSRGLYLLARSFTLLGELQSDQGAIVGPLSAQQSYRQAHAIYREIDLPRRTAQVELLTAVSLEMSGKLTESAERYRRLSADERLSPRDRARAQLWVGTSLSKAGQNSDATQIIGDAVLQLERQDEVEDWFVGQQKLALAYRGTGDLQKASHYIDIAIANRCSDTPMQKVRLSVARAHIMLSDRRTSEAGLRILEDADRISAEFGLMHQRRSLQGIRSNFERTH